MMEDELFRSDLYYRLNVFPIVTPPLREHPEDIPILARHFTRKWVAKVGRQILRISPGTMHALVSWRWLGNVRELENFIARSVILSIGSSLCAPRTEIRDRVRVRVLANTIAGQTPTSTAHIFPS
jgi:formate hydrogenlyase transcriptional activator